MDNVLQFIGDKRQRTKTVGDNGYHTEKAVNKDNLFDGNETWIVTRESNKITWYLQQSCESQIWLAVNEYKFSIQCTAESGQYFGDNG